MVTRRRYSERQKMTAVIAAELTTVEAAAEATGTPRTTLIYWMDQPRFVELRHNAREKMADETLVIARLGWGLVAERMPTMENKDLIAATGMATEKAQLLAGGATARTETRDITGTLSDAELDAAILEAEALARGEAPTTSPSSPEEA